MQRISLRPLYISALLVLISVGCSSPIPRRDPSGERFPSITGESLAGESRRIPEDFAGEPALLFIGYDMQSQFDIDRWILGATQLGLEVRAYELPTIKGMVPGLFSGQIDEGMRSGIPQEDWVNVITIYGDAKQVVAFTGNENDTPARVILLNSEGRVVFFHDRGYSTEHLKRLEETLESLAKK